MPPYRQFDALELYWEPTPYGLHVRKAERQASGFQERADESIIWTRIPYENFPSSGIFGKGSDWFLEKEIFYYAVRRGVDPYPEHVVWIP